jgi:CRISPR-associated endoribonuclease Cas6
MPRAKTPPRTTAKPNLTWPHQPDLIGLQLTLQSTQNCTLPSNYTYWLHAWFLDQIRQIDPNLSAYLHDNQAEKAFTLSGFLGDIQASDRSLQITAQTPCHYYITALCAPACQGLKQWLLQPPTNIKLRDSIWQITDWQIVLPATTYETLWDHATPSGPLTLTFLSPTGFRKNGNHMPLPIPENLFHSYLRRWNTFAHLEFDQAEFLQWVNECVVLLRHDIRSSKAQPGKQGSVTGFIGSIQLGLTPKAQQEPEYVQLVQALISAAPYFGTGHKITFGLGQTRLGWLDPSPAIPASTTPTSTQNNLVGSRSPQEDIVQIRKHLIKTRIAELEPIFLAHKKRQGGVRAKQAAHLWASIIAHQESGDSLKAIAADLKLPYETVKKYAQLARKQIAE